MTDLNALARVEEAQRLIHDAIADVPLTCSGPEAAAAVQGLGLKMAEACMSPRAIAQNLMAQAEAYLRAAPKTEATEQKQTSQAFAILEQAINGMIALGIDKGFAGQMMLTYVVGWLANADRTFAAETLYRLADTMSAPEPKKH